MLKKDGYVYILKHQNGQTVKVGETSISPKSRLEGYSEAYQLEGFTIYKTYRVPLNSRQDIEKRAHAKLKQDRLSGIAGAREIFACTQDKAELAIEEAISESKIYLKELNEQKEHERIQKKEEEIEKEREDLLYTYKTNIKKDWKNSDTFRSLNDKLIKKRASCPNLLSLPFLYWYIWFSFVATSMMCVYGLISSPDLRNSTGYYITAFVILGTILMVWYPASRSKKVNENKKEQELINNKIYDEENTFIQNKLQFFEKFYSESRKK